MIGGLPDPCPFPRTQWPRHRAGAGAAGSRRHPPTRAGRRAREGLHRPRPRPRRDLSPPASLSARATQGLDAGLPRAPPRRRRRGRDRGSVLRSPPRGDRDDGARAGAVRSASTAARPPRTTSTPCSSPRRTSIRPARRSTALRHGLLGRWPRRHDALIIKDDYDAEFRDDPAQSPPSRGARPRPRRHLRLGLEDGTEPVLWLAGLAPPGLAGALEREKRLDDGRRAARGAGSARFVDRDFARDPRRVRPVYRARREADHRLGGELLLEVRHHALLLGCIYVDPPARRRDEGCGTHRRRARAVPSRRPPATWRTRAGPAVARARRPAAQPARRRGIGVSGRGDAANGSDARRLPRAARSSPPRSRPALTSPSAHDEPEATTSAGLHALDAPSPARRRRRARLLPVAAARRRGGHRHEHARARTGRQVRHAREHHGVLAEHAARSSDAHGEWIVAARPYSGY